MKQEVTTKKYSSAVSADRWLLWLGMAIEVLRKISALE